MSSLEHLRKQAKLYLRWHREGYFPVAARIRSLLPRFSDLPDRDILASSFKLSDAQELVARKSGFPSWPALVKGQQSMSSSATSSIATGWNRVADSFAGRSSGSAASARNVALPP